MMKKNKNKTNKWKSLSALLRVYGRLSVYIYMCKKNVVVQSARKAKNTDIALRIDFSSVGSITDNTLISQLLKVQSKCRIPVSKEPLIKRVWNQIN